MWVSPKDRSTAPTPRSPKTTFTLPDMNTMTRDGERNLLLESFYGQIETAFGKVKDKIVSGSPPIESDLEAIVGFVAAQLVRTPKFRDGWQFRAGDHQAQLEAIRDALLGSDIERVLTIILTNNTQLLSLFGLSKAIECLGKMRMMLLKTDDNIGFITSDSPCCFVEYADTRASVLECLESSTSNVLMSLCPSVAAIFDHSPEPHEMIALFPNHPRLHEINALLWNGAVERIVLPRNAIKPEWFSEGVTNKLAQYAVL
jgi:hypothetical protein